MNKDKNAGSSLLSCSLAVISLLFSNPLCAQAEISGASTNQNNQASLADMKAAADQLFWSGKYDSAGSACQKILDWQQKSKSTDDATYARTLINKSVCKLQDLDLPDDELKDVEHDAKAALRLVDKLKQGDNLNKADCSFIIGETSYRLGDYSKAIKYYEPALAIYQAQLSPLSPDTIPCQDGLGGSYNHEKDFDKAETAYKQIVRIDLLTLPSLSVQLAWSLLDLSDIYHEKHQYDLARPLFEKALLIFREANKTTWLDRFDSEQAKKLYSPEERERLKQKITSLLFQFGSPDWTKARENKLDYLIKDENPELAKVVRKQDFDNWHVTRYVRTETPGFSVVDPFVKQKALIVCIHGLGLHHKSYETFGKQISPLGYCINAFDMRGFGTFKDRKGMDVVDFKGCMEDIVTILTMIKRDEPNTPIFLLGESMGGAIALHVAAMHPELIDGLICAVPAGERYKAKRQYVKVARRYVRDRNEPFDIGKQIVNQATSKPELRSEWENDPLARMDLSARELLQFQMFMDQNEDFAQQIKTLPVVVFQGYKDRLVKAKGTFDIFESLATPNKSLILAGDNEHLIFEEGQCKESMVKALAGWLDGHLPTQQGVAAPLVLPGKSDRMPQ